MSMTRRATWSEICSESAIAAELTRRLRERSLSLWEARVWKASVKMSLGMGMRPCSKGSRRGCMYVCCVCVDGGVEVEGVGSTESDSVVMVIYRDGDFVCIGGGGRETERDLCIVRRNSCDDELVREERGREDLLW